MEYLKNSLVSFLFIFVSTLSYSQYNYSYTDPCTLIRKTVAVPQSGNVALNYFGNTRIFSTEDFSNSTFDDWITSVSQQNSSSPCQSVTNVIISTNNSSITANTLAVTTNIMSVMGGGMLPSSNSVDNSTSGGDSEESENESYSNSGKGSDSQSQSEEGETEVGGSSQSTANSISNSIDGGKGDKKKSNKANKNAGSLIASGDVVVISNTDSEYSNQTKFVGSITHSNTGNTRIKGLLFNYTTRINDLSLTGYKSWINPKKTFNLVLANTTNTNFSNTLLNTTTALESFKFAKKYTGMVGVNFTVGKMGERKLLNLSTIAGVHTNFQINPRVSTSILIMGIYSPFTQFYDGKWFDAGALIVPFSSWDIKITKNFKYNISFTGVYQTSGNFLNYQILTGGKLNF